MEPRERAAFLKRNALRPEVWPAEHRASKDNRAWLLLDPSRASNSCSLPGKPVAYNYGLLRLNSGLLWGMVAHDFWLLGFPGRHLLAPKASCEKLSGLRKTAFWCSKILLLRGWMFRTVGHLSVCKGLSAQCLFNVLGSEVWASTGPLRVLVGFDI